jgi:hypothetical protein
MSDDDSGESLRMEAMVRFCFDVELEDILKDEYYDYGGIKIAKNKKTDEEKIKKFASVYSQAQWIIGYMTNMESLKTAKALHG